MVSAEDDLADLRRAKEREAIERDALDLGTALALSADPADCRWWNERTVHPTVDFEQTSLLAKAVMQSQVT